MNCPACGATTGVDAKFCASCGHALRGPEDERRVVTVLFADLVGFTSLSEQLDPERVKNLVDRCFERLAAEITAFGGRVDKIVGDAVVALFGAPVAHEDDAERAVRAALRLHQVVQAEAAESGQELRLRIGINTGEVLVGAMRAAGSITAMGDVVNTAARLQTAAEPGQVLVGPSTHAATIDAIAYEPLGDLAVRGRVETVEAWVAQAPVVEPGSRRRRNDVTLVGRDHEMALLHHAVEASITHDRALLILLVADVGVGKSRLADEIAGWAVDTFRAVPAKGRCLPYGEANVWWPVADALRGALGVDVGAGIDEARRSVRAAVVRTLPADTADDEHDRVTDGMLNLLGFEATVEAEPATVREEIGRALGLYLNAVSSRRPVVFQVSDLHWADEVLLRLIDHVIENVANRPAVLVATARPDLLDRWQPSPGRHNALVLHLDPLDREAARRLLDELAGRPLPEHVADDVLDRSGGNPFFLEELVSLLEAPAGSAGEDAAGAGSHAGELPATLRGLVTARLDALDPEVRGLLQHAAVIGPRGPVMGLRELSRALHPVRGADIDGPLEVLVDEGILDVEDDRWAFRSYLVRDVSYQAITKGDRVKVHHGIARWLEDTYGDQRPRPAWLVDQLAHHFGAVVTLGTELGVIGRSPDLSTDLRDRARRWTVAAAAQARRDQAVPAAIQRYDQAIALAELDPSTTDADLADLHVMRADVGVEAWDFAVASESVDRIEALAPEGESAIRAAALALRGRLAQRRGDVESSLGHLVAAEEMYGRLDLVAERSVTLRHLTLVQIFAGRMDDARESAERSRAGFEAIGDRAGEGWVVQHLAWIAFMQGDRSTAEARSSEAIELFARVNDVRGLAWARGLQAWVRFQGHRIEEAAELATGVLEEARSRRDPWATAMMTTLLASIRLWLGSTDDAVDLARDAHRGFVAIGDPFGIAQSAAVLGRSLVMAGRVDEGVAYLGDVSSDLVRATRIAIAAQLGEPERADVPGATTASVIDQRVADALLALQRGDLAAAGAQLDVDGPGDPDTNLWAARAMWLAASGRDGSDEMADAVDGAPSATYLDRAVAEIAAALRAAAVGDGDTAAVRFERARKVIEPTGDRVARNAYRVAAELARDHLGAGWSSSEDQRRPGWSLPGAEAHGWQVLFEAILGAGATTAGGLTPPTTGWVAGCSGGRASSCPTPWGTSPWRPRRTRRGR
ncbi:MAG: AAA family ATPase [Actinobacteria bacterium]|nr:AAA family ATPase [Actinomycetota bacterium]